MLALAAAIVSTEDANPSTLRKWTLSRSVAYKRYIASKAWNRRRKAWYRKHGRHCRACSSTKNLHLHHRTYERLGTELDEDLVALCESCHDHVHQFHRTLKGVDLSDATDQWLSNKWRHYGKPHSRKRAPTPWAALEARQRNDIRNRPRPTPKPYADERLHKPEDQDLRAAAIAAGKYARPA